MFRILKLAMQLIYFTKHLGQNHLLTNFVKTNFPKLISLIWAFLLAYIKTNFAITHSTILHMIFLLTTRRETSWPFWLRVKDWKKILSYGVCWRNIFFSILNSWSNHSYFSIQPRSFQKRLNNLRATVDTNFFGPLLNHM